MTKQNERIIHIAILLMPLLLARTEVEAAFRKTL